MGGVRNEKDKRLRAMEIVRRHIVEGEKVKDIAKDMKVSEDTVQRSLEYARKANLFVKYENLMWEELLPLAHEAAKLALQDGDAKVALEILKGARILKTGNSTAQAAEKDDEGLYGEIARIRAGWTIDVTPARELSSTVETGDSPDVIDITDDRPTINGHTATTTSESENRDESIAKVVETRGGSDTVGV